MKRIASIAVVASVLSFSAAKADPSFPCSGNLNQTERQICDDVLLGDLDREMARFFFQARDGVTGARRDELVSDQRLWLHWRNACGEDGHCIRRRYQHRIIDLAPPDELPVAWQQESLVNPSLAGATPTYPDQVVDRRVAGARYEVEFADGTVRWQALDGGAEGADFPDGTGTRSSLSQAPPPDFPSLPGAYSAWGDSVEAGLLEIIDRMLSPADRDRYRTLTTSRPYSIRIYDHIRVINFLSIP